jgi:hypothetical protein
MADFLNKLLIDEYYEFKHNGTFYRYTPKVFKTTFRGVVFSPEVIRRDRILLTDNPLKNIVKISLPVKNTFARTLISFFPNTPVTINIYKSYGLTDFLWQGNVISAVGNDDFIDLECSTIHSNTTRATGTKKVQLTCNHTLYNLGCRLNKESFRYNGVITSSSNNNRTINFTLSTGAVATPTEYFKNCELIYNNQVKTCLSFLGSGAGYTANLSSSIYPFDEEITGPIRVYPTCDLLSQTCKIKFKNFINYSGWIRMPKRSPYSQEGIL